MSDDQSRRIASKRDDELSPEERQETRYTNERVLEDFVDPSEIKRRHEQHDDLWWAFGWIPQIFKNWKKVCIVIVIAVVLGGEPLIDSVSAILRRYLP